MLRPVLRRWLARGTLAAGVALSIGAGCAVTSPGVSPVAKGERYRPGEGLYDRFFADLHASQIFMAEVPGDEQRVRRALAKAVEARADSPEALEAAIDERVQQLSRADVWARLDIRGEPGDENAEANVAVSGAASPEQQAFLDAVQAGARGELELLSRLSAQLEDLERLESMALGLERNVDNTFRMQGVTKRAEVKKNVHDAQALIPLMKARAQETASQSRRTLKKLEHALSTLPQAPPAPVPTAAAPEPEPKAPAPPGSWHSPSRPARGRAPRTDPRPPPVEPAAPQKASPAPDFEP